MLESKIEKALRLRVEKKGGVCLKWVCPGKRGAPDRIIILPRRSWDGYAVAPEIRFVETKAPGKKLSPSQKLFHAMLKRLGCDVKVIDYK